MSNSTWLDNIGPDEIVDAIPETHTEVRELAAAVGPDVFVQLVRAFGGCHIYIPNLKDVQRQVRNREALRLLADGHTVLDAARRLGISENTVYAIRREAWGSHSRAPQAD